MKWTNSLQKLHKIYNYIPQIHTDPLKKLDVFQRDTLSISGPDLLKKPTCFSGFSSPTLFVLSTRVGHPSFLKNHSFVSIKQLCLRHFLFTVSGFQDVQLRIRETCHKTTRLRYWGTEMYRNYQFVGASPSLEWNHHFWLKSGSILQVQQGPFLARYAWSWQIHSSKNHPSQVVATSNTLLGLITQNVSQRYKIPMLPPQLWRHLWACLSLVPLFHLSCSYRNSFELHLEF